MAFIVTDELGRKTLILKRTERAVRMAWSRMQKINATFGMRPVAIASLQPAAKDSEQC